MRPTQKNTGTVVRSYHLGRYPHFFLFGLASGGVYHATFVTKSAVSSYLTLSPFPAIAGR